MRESAAPPPLPPVPGHAAPSPTPPSPPEAARTFRPNPFADDDPDAPPFAEYHFRRWWMRREVPWCLWRYIGLETLRVMLLGVITVSLLYSALAAYQTVRGGIQLTYIWPFIAKTVAYPLYFSIPLSLLFGVTLAIGRLVADREIAAMRFQGMSHRQLYVPIAVLAILAAIASHAVNGWVIPDLRYEKRNLQQYVLKQLENLGSGYNRTILLPDGGGSLLVGAYEGTELWKVEVDLSRSLQSRFVPEIRGQLPQRLPDTITILARFGKLEIAEDRRGVLIHLRGVEVLVPETSSGGERFYQRFAITDTLTIPLSFDRKERAFKDLVQPELAEHIAMLETRAAETPSPSTAQELAVARTEWHRRNAFTFSSLTFPLVGVCLTFLFERRNRLLPFLLGNMAALGLFYPGLMVGSYLSEHGYWPWLAMAIPNLLLLVTGVWLVRLVSRR